MPSKGEETRERIVERAFRLATRAGVEGLTLGALATDLGMSKSGLFAHFKSKEELQLDVLRAAVDRFQEAVIKPALRAPRGVPRLQALFRNWMAWLRDAGSPGGCLFVAAAAELDDREGRPREFLAAQQGELLELIAGLARVAVKEGQVRHDLDARQLAFEIQAVVLGTHQALRLLRDPKAIERGQKAFERLLTDAVIYRR
jgi:AcrR family transcriptional regulator